MAIKADVGKAKQKAAEEAARAASYGAFGAIKWWQPKRGKNTIRIMPPWTEEGINGYQWWRECWVHWGIGPDDGKKQNIACPVKTPPGGGICPICEEVSKLRETGDPADLEMAKQLKARMRNYANVIDLKDAAWTEDDLDELRAAGTDESKLPSVGDPKIQIFSFGSTIFKDLLDYYTDNVDFTDLETGYDITITKEGEGIGTDYRVRTAQNPSKAPVPDDDPKVHNLDAVMVVKSTAEIKAALEGVDPEEVKKLESAQSKIRENQKKLSAAKQAQKESEEEEVNEDGEVNEEVEEEATEDEPEEVKTAPPPAIPKKAPVIGKKAVAEFNPYNAEGYIDYDKLADEDLENREYEKYTDPNESSVFLVCFGAARQRNEKDEACLGCPLFKRCGERVKALDAAEGKKGNGKRPVGRPPGKKVEIVSGTTPEVDDLEEQMRAAIKSRK